MRLIILLILFRAQMVMAQFLPSMEDIPQMDGLTRVEETATFENPSEKMVIVSAQTDKTQSQVMDYYRQTLINLGWSEVQSNHFVRSGDTLTMEFGQKTVQFTLVLHNL